jgi:DNA-binding transcriptional regulator YiaG
MSGGGNLLYIGQSLNICQRWKGHHLKRQLKAGASLHIAYRETFSEVGRLKMEAILIRRHQPRLNANLLPRLPKPAAPHAAMEGTELQQRREALGMSRDELAKALQTTSVSVWRWENGERAVPPYLSLALETVERERGKILPDTQKPATGQIRRSNGTSTTKKGGKK